MFVLRTALWVIDIRNVVVELQITLLSDSDDSLETKYDASTAAIVKLASVEPLLYAYMVRYPLFHRIRLPASSI